MISIRANLLCWLLPGFAAICIVAGIGIYFSFKSDAEVKLDAQLTELVDDIRLRPQQQRDNNIGTQQQRDNNGGTRRRRDRDTVIAEFQEALSRKQFDWKNLLQNMPSGVYCELLLGSVEKNIKTVKTHHTTPKQRKVG